MTVLWTGIVVGAFALAVAALLVVCHYCREWLMQRQLRRMDYRHCWDLMRHRR